MAKFLTLTDKCNCFCTFCYEISPTGEPHVFVAELDALKEEMRQAMHVEGWNDIVITGGGADHYPDLSPCGCSRP